MSKRKLELVYNPNKRQALDIEIGDDMMKTIFSFLEYKELYNVMRSCKWFYALVLNILDPSRNSNSAIFWACEDRSRIVCFKHLFKDDRVKKSVDYYALARVAIKSVVFDAVREISKVEDIDSDTAFELCKFGMEFYLVDVVRSLLNTKRIVATTEMLAKACTISSSNIVSLLLEQPGVIPSEDMQNGLSIACIKGKESVAHALLDSPKVIPRMNHLEIAFSKCQYTIAIMIATNKKLCLEKKEDIDRRNYIMDYVYSYRPHLISKYQLIRK